MRQFIWYAKKKKKKKKKKKQKQKQKKISKHFFSIIFEACKCEVSLSCSDDISRTTCTAIPNSTQLFQVPTRNSCCYSKPGSRQSNAPVVTTFSQLFQV